ncbi:MULTISPECIES: hypothetical protein [unclassified Streptomyces]|uniref:hypothetical protein n=1 Tax=unclassified Streptomyces TaxID=2593676 RepID=UPI001D039904|nr:MULTISPECIES: hypothetical protein [unclassified Streptomyces]
MNTHPTPAAGTENPRHTQDTAPHPAPAGGDGGHDARGLPHRQPVTGPLPPPDPSPAGALLGLRSAIILTLGVLVGAGAGVLTYLSQHDGATAFLAGGAAFAAAVLFFQNVVGT